MYMKWGIDMKDMIYEPNNDKEVFLTTVTNGIEADVIEALLRSNKIPLLKKYKEAGAYLDIYMGSTNMGIDLYVPSNMLEQAKELIANEPGVYGEEYQEQSGEEIDKLNDDLKKNQRIRRWFLIFILFPAVLTTLALIYSYIFP